MMKRKNKMLIKQVEKHVKNNTMSKTKETQKTLQWIKFEAILQILYQREWLVYFNNKIVVTFDLTNRGQLANLYSIFLTQLLVKLIYWTECQKKIIANPISSKTKVDNCCSGPILNILFGKWLPLHEVLSPRISTPEEPMS